LNFKLLNRPNIATKIINILPCPLRQVILALSSITRDQNQIDLSLTMETSMTLLSQIVPNIDQLKHFSAVELDTLLRDFF